MPESKATSPSVPDGVKGSANDESGSVKRRDAFLFLGASGVAAVAAGIITTAVSKRRARQYFATLGHEPVELPESGTALALRALCYSTIITVGIFSMSIFGLCKWFDIKSMEDLRAKVRKARKSTGEGEGERTEFENLSDFFNYLNERYGKKPDGK